MERPHLRNGSAGIGSNGGTSLLEEVAKSRRNKEFQHEKQALLDLLDSHLSGMIDRASNSVSRKCGASATVDGMKTVESLAALDASIGSKGKASHQLADDATTDERLPQKNFHLRNSLLTELFELSHFRTLQNIFIAIMSLFCLNTIISDLLEGKLLMDTLSLPLIFWAFGRLSEAIAIWLLMHLVTLLVFYPAFHHYVSMAGPKGHSRYSNTLWLLAYTIFQAWFLVQPIRMLVQAQLPPASAITVLTEQARLMMKIHAFLWENVRCGQFPKTPTDASDAVETNDVLPRCPSFGKFLYFLFAPTLVYRDNYPRTESVRWGYVASNLGQVVAGIFFVYLLIVRYCLPVFSHWRRPSLAHFIHTAFQSALPGGLVLLIVFFCILHSWLNAFAEMLRFGDRLFYYDWWNATSFRTWYRTWNTVVHDWLYAYVYRELCILLGYDLRLLATICVFLLSAVFHELVISFALGFFFPAMFVFFCSAGFALMFANGRSRLWSVFVWASLFLGMGMLMCLYSMEWFARRNCPSHYPDNSLLDFLMPRSFTCDS